MRVAIGAAQRFAQARSAHTISSALKGVLAPLSVPFHSNGKVDYEAFQTNVAYLATTDLTGFLVQDVAHHIRIRQRTHTGARVKWRERLPQPRGENRARAAYAQNRPSQAAAGGLGVREHARYSGDDRDSEARGRRCSRRCYAVVLQAAPHTRCARHTFHRCTTARQMLFS
jgi:hypothetical protein